MEPSDSISRRSEVVVVTGAAAGVGRATAVEFARQGASAVGLIARDRNQLESAAAEIRQLGAQALAIEADVADADKVEAAADQIERELGPIDIWVNDAMVTVFSRFTDIAADEYRRVTEVTYLGTVNGTRTALRRMLPRERGAIVQVGSALAYRSIPLQSAYCGAKAAIRGFTDSLRTELLHDGHKVHITMVQLPAVNTPQFDWCRTHIDHHPQPVPPIYDPSVPARAIVWAAHHRRRELYLGFPTLIAIEANKFIPGLLDRYLARTGFKSQQTSEVIDPNRRNNLFEPVHGDFGARGSFTSRSWDGSIEFWLSRNRTALAVLAGLALGYGLVRRSFQSTPREPVSSLQSSRLLAKAKR